MADADDTTAAVPYPVLVFITIPIPDKATTPDPCLALCPRQQWDDVRSGTDQPYDRCVITHPRII